jgi:hypothetical protein
VVLPAGIAQWYSAGLRARWSGVRVPAGAGNFSLHHCVQTCSGAHPASYPMGTRGSFPVVKRPGREADYLPPYSAEVKKLWSYTSTPPYAFMMCSVKAQGQLYLYQKWFCSSEFNTDSSVLRHYYSRALQVCVQWQGMPVVETLRADNATRNANYMQLLVPRHFENYNQLNFGM